MLFNSFSFAVFLPIVFSIYWLIPHKFRWVLLLSASYFFYMSWNAKYVILILLTTFISYFAALLLEKSKDKNKKKKIIITASVICLGVLFFFKYYNFASESIVNILSIFSIQLSPITLKLLLPVGISFYTFQTLSYVIDVYRGEVKAEHHFGKYATFISFFPQLVAGPIERTSNLLPQIQNEHKFCYSQASYGLKLMAWGYFKKMVIADTLSPYVSKVYDSPYEFSGFALGLATIFFTLQIYCDFSGYSDIAIGTAKLMGINLMSNFKSPYFSQSIKEFWGRWHISLSTWFRDYVYIPLGGNRLGKFRHVCNLLVTFLLSGLWHGANWTFVIWGGIHGLGQVIENAVVPKEKLKDRSKGIIGILRVLFVFSIVSFAWIFFVSNSLSDATYVISHLFTGMTLSSSYLHAEFANIGLGKVDLVFLFVSIVMLAIYDYVSIKTDVIEKISSHNKFIRWAIYIAFILWIMLNLPVSNQTEFIYFQF